MTETRYTHEMSFEHYEVAAARREIVGSLNKGEWATGMSAAPGQGIAADTPLGGSDDTKAEGLEPAARVTPAPSTPEILAHSATPMREVNLLEVR